MDCPGEACLVAGPVSVCSWCERRMNPACLHRYDRRYAHCSEKCYKAWRKACR